LEKVRLYIDEDLSDRIAVALRSKGFDAISAHEVNMRGKTDKEQLEYAIQHNPLFPPLIRGIKLMLRKFSNCFKVISYEAIRRIIKLLDNHSKIVPTEEGKGVTHLYYFFKFTA